MGNPVCQDIQGRCPEVRSHFVFRPLFAHARLSRLIPFALIIIIAEETIPLVVLWAPFLLPSTCVLPAQKERILSKKRATQQANVEAHGSVFNEILKRSSSEKDLKALLGYEGSNALCGYARPSSAPTRVLTSITDCWASPSALMVSSPYCWPASDDIWATLLKMTPSCSRKASANA